MNKKPNHKTNAKSHKNTSNIFAIQPFHTDGAMNVNCLLLVLFACTK